MSMQTLHIKNCYALQDQTIDLHPKLNIILGKNGSGKTTLFKHIKLHNPNARSYFLHFDTEDLNDFIRLKNFENTSITNKFYQEYQVITKMFDNVSLIEKCNELFKIMGFTIQVSTNIIDTKLLTFTRSGTKSLLLIKDLSRSEQAIFLMFLIANLDKTPDILFFDNFDFEFVDYRFEKYQTLNNKEEDKGFTYLFHNLFKNSQVFVITHTAKKFLFYPEDAKCFFIKDGLCKIC